MGSSSSNSSGAGASARAIARRFFPPPESVDVGWAASAKPAFPMTTAVRPSTC